MNYNDLSEWNDKNEIECLIIFKKLQQAHFPRGLQTKLCKELSFRTKLSVNTISAKVSNYKSEFGVNNPSNSSTNTSFYAKKYKSYSIEQLKKLIQEINN